MKKIFNNCKQKKIRQKLRNNATETEQLLWGILRKKNLGVKFVRQYGIGEYIVDFYCPQKKLAIEIDGGQHFYEENIKYDQKRTLYLNKLGIKVIRFTNADVFNNLENVCNEIIYNLETLL